MESALSELLGFFILELLALPEDLPQFHVYLHEFFARLWSFVLFLLRLYHKALNNRYLILIYLFGIALCNCSVH